MNIKNNRRKRESIDKIQLVFVELLSKKDITDITVTEICKMTGLNRSTFYANFLDVYDLADKLAEKIKADFDREFFEKSDNTAEKFFKYIYENRDMFRLFFKLGFEEKYNAACVLGVDKNFDMRFSDYTDISHKAYHIEFFRNGMNAIIKMWLSGGCRESPEEMAQIIAAEYKGR